MVIARIILNSHMSQVLKTSDLVLWNVFLFPDILGPPQGLAHLDLGHVHVHKRRKVHRVARRRLGRLDTANKIRTEKRQWHVRMPGE